MVYIWRYTDFPSGGYRHKEAGVAGGGSGGQPRDREKSTGGGSRRLHGSRRDKDRGYRDDDSYDSYDSDSALVDDHRRKRSGGENRRDRDPLSDSF